MKEKEYENPVIKITEILFEESMMTTSSEVRPEENRIPDIADWTDGGDINGDFELL